jgi:methionine-rich copper-binding protein CopC
VWLVLSCAPALAHARLEEAYPNDGSTLSGPPEQVQLLFNEPIEAEFDPLKDNARVSPNNRKLLVVDLEELPEDSYTVDWRVTSADGHPVNGTRRFAVDASVAGGVGEPIEPIERSAEREETSGLNSHIIHTVVLGVGTLVVLVLVLRRKS